MRAAQCRALLPRGFAHAAPRNEDIRSRVIGVFEGTIEKLVALATLMPIVAGIAGNSGNRTTTLIIRALARDR